MNSHRPSRLPDVVDTDWITFPGGELEGPRPKALCPVCRARLQHLATAPNLENHANPVLCFQCYRVDLDRERGLKAAGAIDTASEQRFQTTLPFEKINRPRLERLRAERATARVAAQAGVGRYVDKRRHAQIEARHALERIAAGLKTSRAAAAEQHRVMSAAFHAAELQLPAAWLPFVVAR
jgi:hypothetical protein